MSLQPVDVQRIFLRPVPQMPVRGFSFRVFLSGYPARSGKRGAGLSGARINPRSDREAGMQATPTCTVLPIGTDRPIRIQDIFAAWCRDRLVDVSPFPSAGRFIFQDCLLVGLLRGRILTRSGWIFLGHTDVVSSGRACGADVMAANVLQRRFFLRGRSMVDRLTHNQQDAGSSPVPATIFPEWFREPGASERQLARSGEFFYADGELCRAATRRECAALLAVCLVGSIALVALIFWVGGVF